MSPTAKLFAATYFLGCCLAMLAGSLLPSDKGLVAVFAKPWGESAAEIVAQADGRIIFVGDSAMVAITEVTDHAFIDRLYNSGAGFVASSAVASACARWSGLSLERAL